MKPPAGEGDSPPLVSPHPDGERLNIRVEEAGSQEEGGSRVASKPGEPYRWRALSVLYVQPQRLLVAYTPLPTSMGKVSVDKCRVIHRYAVHDTE